MTHDAARGRPVASLAVDGAVIVAGAAVMVLSLVASGLHRPGLPPLLLLTVPAIVLISRYPLELATGSGALEIAFDSGVLVFLLMFAPPAYALALWSIGTVLAQATLRKRWSIRAFNCGVTVLAGAVMTAALQAFRPLRPSSARELLAVTAGCAAYVLLDLLLSAVSAALEEGIPVRRGLLEPHTLLGLGVFVGVESLGYLAALTVRGLPGWALGLLAVPVTALLVAARAMSRAREHEARLSGLFSGARHTQGLQTAAELLDAVTAHACAVLQTEQVVVRRTGPAGDEVGALVHTDADGTLWLVGAPRFEQKRYDDADRHALEALAAVLAESLARVRLLDELAGQARTDPLTGLANRSAFAERVRQSVEGYHRHGRRLGVVYIDLDGFKAVNDLFGHHVGDAVLVCAAERLVACMRPTDLVARLGGDEFAVLVCDLEPAGPAGSPDPRGAAEEVCARILEVFRPDFVVGGSTHCIRASAGMALVEPGVDADGLLRNADMAMYQAKAHGRDRYEIYRPELRRANLGRLKLEEQLRGALDAGQLVLHYQPVVELATGRVDGFETLLRWNHPERGLIGPGEFVPIAEQAGLILPIGEWVLRQVVADGAVLAEAAGRPMSVGVNVSGRQLRDGGLPALLAELLGNGSSDGSGDCGGGSGGDGSGSGNQHLILELTESTLIGDDPDSRRTLHELRELGISLAIDDFGTGYSSIGYLRELPVDVLKIDRSFLVSVGVDARSTALVEAILQMSRALDLAVVAEGIERPDQALRLRALGCQLGQGYLFSPPLDRDAAARYLLDTNPGRATADGVLSG